MKRFLILLALLCFLSGCGAGERGASTPETTTVPAETTAPETTETAPAPSLMDGRKQVDEDGVLYEISNETLEGRRYQTLYPFGDNLLSSVQISSDAETYELRLAVLDLETGLPLHETTIPDVQYATVQVSGAGAAVCDYGTGNVILFDETLQETGRCKLDTDWNTICVDTGRKIAYSFFFDGGIQTMDLATGEPGLLLEGAHELSVFRVRPDQVIFRYLDPDTQLIVYATLDLRMGIVEPLALSGDFMLMDGTDGVLLADMMYQAGTFLYGPADALSVFTAEDSTVSLQEDGLLRLCDYTADGAQCLRLYDQSGAFLSACTVPGDSDTYLSDDLIWSDRYGGYFFTATSYNSETKLMFWDMSVPVEGEDLALSSYAELTAPAAGQAVAAELYERAAALSATYGVQISIADQCPTEYNTYTVEQNLDYWQISAGLDALDTALSSYPSGFLPQLLHDYSKEIDIELVGTLTPIDLPETVENGFSEFAAFVEPQSGKIYMVMDLGQYGGLEENCYHEISHMIDEKLAFDAMYRDGALFSEEGWAALNPEGFEYACSYYDIPESFTHDGYDSYFVDLYARTYPTEDRARILEYAMIGWTWMFSEENSPLRAKLQYYSDCIRDSFDTTGWPAVTKWEAALGD
ncbi:MAG: hypothetical protein VB055_08885 [Oscillospiraceae bacterium]|nr:hypothetical protein [Oscillospiraceae bacterium]